ncbi:MAG: OmpA family protein [Nevskia sp.]|nr:OmpA family protein [Nevskia sp.]
MRHFASAIAPVLIAAACAAQADDAADSQDRSKLSYSSNDYIAILPGYALPDKKRGTERSGFTISALYGYQLDPHFSVEGGVQGSVFDTGVSGGTDFYQSGANLDLVFGFTDRRTAPVTPYVLLGIAGLYNDVYPQHNDGVSFAGEAGLGLVSTSLYHGVRLRAEGRYVHDTFQSGYNDFRALLGVEIPLGRVVERPLQAQGDQVQVREVVKEVPRPWVDSDGDGVDDEHDLCPNTPKGLRVDAHGCPLPGQTIELRGVNFEFNSARLTANAMTILDGVVPAFVGEPSLQVEVGGHTDGKGKASYNLKLSQKRAESVRAYLVSKGAKPEQLVAKGYGKTQPVVTPEKSDADRELNRRVEFKILQK